ncbi:MAG: J domain-containing protein [Synergistaceae bacterium]|nr:J domain-containing protein [Synergistaceae bacterium]
MENMKGNSYHYSVLGLEPGASDEEIRGAYRRLVKMYHPDRDGSLDAEMKYREIQAAYSALRGQNTPIDDQRPQWEKERKTNYEQGMASRQDVGSGNFWVDDEPPRRPRIPFSWGELVAILGDSLKESIGLGLVVRTGLCVRMLWILFRSSPLSRLLGMVTIPCLLAFCLVFRYYNVKATRKKIFFIASVGCAFFASLCYTWFSSPKNRPLGAESAFFVTLIAWMLLWVKVKLDFLPSFLRIRAKRPHER